MSLKVGSAHWDLDLDTKDFDKKLGKASDSMKGLDGLLKDAERGSWMFAGALTAVSAAAFAGAGFGIKIAANLETMTQGFVTLLGSTEKANEAIKMIKRDAASTPFDLPGLIQANLLLTAVTKDAPKSERLLLNVGKALTAMGKGQPELDRIIVNLQQIGAVGKASMLDVKQFAFAGIPIFEMLTEATGKSGEALGDLITDGGVTFEMLEEMFNSAGEGAGRFAKTFETQAGTYNQTFSNLVDNVGIAMSEIVTQTGLFDTVKAALSGLTTTIEENTDLIIEKVKGFSTAMQENSPIIIGAIVGGLTPAFYGLASSIIAATAPLLPFIAVGVLVGAMVQLLLGHFGGLEGVTEIIRGKFEELKTIFEVVWGVIDQYLGPVFDMMINEFNKNLIPALGILFNSVKKLEPVFKVIAAVMGVVVGGAVAALMVGITALARIFSVIAIMASDAIEMVVKVFKWLYDKLIGHSIIPDIINGIVGWFKSLPDKLMSALGGLADKITAPFKDAFKSISGITDNIKESLNKINPFARFSPSLVDQVKAGVAQIERAYSSLEINPMPAVAAAGLGAGVAGQNSQNITINIDKVRDMQDVHSIGAELGFRTGISPRFQGGF